MAGDDLDQQQFKALHDELLAVAAGLSEKFPDRPPTDEEVRTHLVDRLVERGHSREQAARMVAQLD